MCQVRKRGIDSIFPREYFGDIIEVLDKRVEKWSDHDQRLSKTWAREKRGRGSRGSRDSVSIPAVAEGGVSTASEAATISSSALHKVVWKDDQDEGSEDAEELVRHASTSSSCVMYHVSCVTCQVGQASTSSSRTEGSRSWTKRARSTAMSTASRTAWLKSQKKKKDELIQESIMLTVITNYQLLITD
jgi:hypothetical protein